MKIVINKEISSREELDAYIRKTFGDDASKNGEITLEILPEAIKELSLGEDVTVFGVKIKKVEEIEVKKEKE